MTVYNFFISNDRKHSLSQSFWFQPGTNFFQTGIIVFKIFFLISHLMKVR